MNLFGKQKKKEYSVAVLLRHGDGQGFLLESDLATRAVKLLDQRAFIYTNGWDNLTYDIDELLFNLENDHKIELRKTAFFVYSHLVNLVTREITPEHKTTLEQITKDNELETLGYLEMDQIMAKYLTKKEGSSLSAILIEIDTPAVSAFIYQAGELLFSESVARSDDIVADLTELFARTQKDTSLPSRLIMYDSGGLEEEASKVIAHKWSKDIFMHVPKVDIITELDITNAILQESPEYLNASAAGEAIPLMADAQDKMDVGAEELSMDEGATATIPEDLGFIIGADVKNSHLPEPMGTDVYESTQQISPQSAVVPIMSRVKNLLHMPRINFSGVSRKKPIIIGVVILLLLVAGLGASLYYLHSATLTVYYEKSEIKESVDFEKADFIEKKTETIDTEASIETTGSKKIGEKATGSITIYNATESDKTFKKGTKLTAPNKLIFILDSDVTVAAATKTVTSGGDILTTTSKEKASITAEDIGTSYNIPNESKFTFEGSSDTTYFAKSNEAVSGGTEKEIQTASKDDFKRINAEIQKQINKKKADALKEAADARRVLDDLTEIELVKEDYSKEVAEEAKTLDAKVTAEVTYYLYDEKTVRDALVSALQDKIPENYELKPENISFKVTSSEKIDDTISLTLEAKGEPTYKINQKELISLIKGKSTGSLEKLLKEHTDTKGYLVEVASPIPLFKLFTPFFDKNFKVITEPLE